MARTIGLTLAALMMVCLGAIGWLSWGWYFSYAIEEDATFIVPPGASVRAVAEKLAEEGHVQSALNFRVGAQVLGPARPIQAGEYLLPRGAAGSDILAMMQVGEVVRRFVTIPEGMPSVLVHESLMAVPYLTGEIAVPAEGSVLPETYDFELGESRAAVLLRMQEAMRRALEEEWARRAEGIAVSTPEEAVILASIVEKETGVPRERRLVAGLYSNRLKRGMRLQADPTVIYPITQGRPLGRRIRRSELEAVNGYNTYTRTGLPIGPIANPGRASIAAVLAPSKTRALYMVADGSGGHAFAETLAEHNANVARWYGLRRARGEM